MKVRPDTGNEELFNRWIRLNTDANSIFQGGAALVQNDMPDVPIEEVIAWKKEILTKLEQLNMKIKYLIGETLQYVIEGD